MMPERRTAVLLTAKAQKQHDDPIWSRRPTGFSRPEVKATRKRCYSLRP